jgi:hypothetical protein
VQARSHATISGSANGLAKSKKLTVDVAASVSPRSLGFAEVVVGTTSGVLSTMLSNVGAVPFAIDEISLTGTNARHYSQTGNCPASLAPGASCAIEVRFAPTVTGRKPAKLSIVTSATSTPLGVSLSGTGI